MFDQSLSVKNFRIIYNLDRKNKGRLEKDYFPAAFKQRTKIRDLKKYMKNLSLRLKKRLVSNEYFEIRKERANKLIELRKNILNNEVDEQLNSIVKTVSAKGYSFTLTKSNPINEKEIFSIGNDIETILVSKHIQMVLSSLYRVKTTNRDLIISRLSTIIKDSSPKYIIRTDVESFYESIDHKELLNILHSSPKLSVTPRRILTQLIRSYAKLSGSSKGLPRGVGVSAYLSEIYMGNVDKEINSLADITYYERYVDDIIAIFSPSKKEHLDSYLTNIDNIIRKKKLLLNHKKTKELDLFNHQSKRFDYLGYHFMIEDNFCKIKLSRNKKDKLKKRLNLSFDQFQKEYKSTPKVAFKKLLLRIRFLTGNTRLLNSKSNAFIGVFFSNKFINDTSDLRDLDKFLTYKIDCISNPRHKNRLKKLSFVQGFDNRVFRKFNIKDLNLISKGWSND